MPGRHVGEHAALGQRHMALAHEAAVGEADVCVFDAGVAVAADLHAVRAIVHARPVHDQLTSDCGDATQAVFRTLRCVYST